MKLTSFHIWDYKIIDDSNEIVVDQNVTCFVGKNEAGKTAVLQALYRLNPIEAADFDETNSYPRKRLRKYQRNVDAGTEESAKVITATFDLDNNDISAITEQYGECVSVDSPLTITKKYDDSKLIGLKVDEQKWVKHYTNQSNLEGTSAQKSKATKSLESLITALEECEDDTKAQACLAYLKQVDEKGLAIEIWGQCL
ncbi:conserved hypothetical protein, partial [methanotrophic bacterial endosymbiont of Bathymodiolus sp.]